MTEATQEQVQEKEAGLKALRWPVYRIIDPMTRWLVRRRVHPNAITLMGFAATIVAGWLYSADHVRTAGFFVLLGGLFDIFDGRVARISGLASKPTASRPRSWRCSTMRP